MMRNKLLTTKMAMALVSGLLFVPNLLEAGEERAARAKQESRQRAGVEHRSSASSRASSSGSTQTRRSSESTRARRSSESTKPRGSSSQRRQATGERRTSNRRFESENRHYRGGRVHSSGGVDYGTPRHRSRRYYSSHHSYRHSYPYRHYYSPRYFYPGYYGSYGFSSYYSYPRLHFYFPFPYAYAPHVSVYGGYRGGGHHGDYHGDSGSQRGLGGLDFDVRPESAEIYLDGQLIGTADNFDGFPTYLWLEQGTYDVVIYREGYETISRQYSVYPGVIIDVEDKMVRGQSVRPEDLVSKSTVHRDERLRRDRERREEAERRRSDSVDAEIGRLFFFVKPGDAAVYLDGYFVGTGAELSGLTAGLIVEPGSHVVEIVRPGLSSENREITVAPGGRYDFDLELGESP